MRVRDAETEQGPKHVYRDHGARLWRAASRSPVTGIADDAVAEAFARALARG